MHRLPVVAVAMLLAGSAQAADAYWVQVGAPQTFREAAVWAAVLGEKSDGVRGAYADGRLRINQFKDSRGEYWRVRIGPFDVRDTAQAFCANLQASKIDCITAR